MNEPRCDESNLENQVRELRKQVDLFQASERKRIEVEEALERTEEKLRENERRFLAMRKDSELEHARAEEQLRQLTQQSVIVQEAERRRISQDLHDDIGQQLTVLILRLRSIQSSLPSEFESQRDELEGVIQSVQGLTTHIRQLAYQLRPPSLDSMPLSQAVRSLCTLFGQRSSLAIHFSCDPDLPPVPNVLATVLYRFLQEGLNNVVKHAQASSVWISLDYADGEVALSIEDDGMGLNLQQVELGMGLQGVRDRFIMLNGMLDIESSPGYGARLVGTLPMANHNL